MFLSECMPSRPNAFSRRGQGADLRLWLGDHHRKSKQIPCQVCSRHSLCAKARLAMFGYEWTRWSSYLSPITPLTSHLDLCVPMLFVLVVCNFWLGSTLFLIVRISFKILFTCILSRKHNGFWLNATMLRVCEPIRRLSQPFQNLSIGCFYSTFII
jgi:hypothetical protein